MSNLIKAIAFLILLLGITQCQPDPYREGRFLYQRHCENCHMEDGSGLSGLIPSLKNSKVVTSEPASLLCIIRNGIKKNPTTGQEMPANTQLNDVELTNLINYLRSLYTIKADAIKVSEVNEWMMLCQ